MSLGGNVVTVVKELNSFIKQGFGESANTIKNLWDLYNATKSPGDVSYFNKKWNELSSKLGN